MRAVFAGKTKSGANAVLYRDGSEFYIKVDDDALQMLTSPGFTSSIQPNFRAIRLKIESPEWSGEIVADRFDLVVEEDFNL